MNGKLPQKTTLNPSLDLSIVSVLRILLWMIIGGAALFLHVRLKSPLQMPGHHGLEFMAMLTLLRLNSNYRWATTIASAGMGVLLLMPFFSFNDPLLGINYLLPGIILDLLFILLSVDKKQFIIASFLAGLAYISIPISKLAFELLSGIPSTTFLKNGYILPFFSYFIFGSFGGFLACILEKPLQKLQK